jgi:hypothetical protein
MSTVVHTNGHAQITGRSSVRQHDDREIPVLIEFFLNNYNVILVFYILFVLCRSVYCLCVNVYCTTAIEWKVTS